jgi:hypothetical protein
MKYIFKSQNIFYHVYIILLKLIKINSLQTLIFNADISFFITS